MSLNTQELVQCFDCGKKNNKDKFQGIMGFMLCQICHQLQGSLFMNYKSKKQVLQPQYVQIQQGIFLGNQDAAMDKNTFEKTGITAVCVCGSYLHSPFKQHYQYKIYQISDHPQQSILKYFQQNYQWINKIKQQKKKVLVHCAAGVSRSASFVIAYIMRSKNISFQQSKAIVKAKRPIICPNSGFVKQLKQYEQICLKL